MANRGGWMGGGYGNDGGGYWGSSWGGPGQQTSTAPRPATTSSQNAPPPSPQAPAPQQPAPSSQQTQQTTQNTPSPSPNGQSPSPTPSPSPDSNPNHDRSLNSSSSRDDALLSRVLSANPSLTQVATNALVTIDSSIVVAVNVKTDGAVTYYVSVSPSNPISSSSPTAVPATSGGISSGKSSSPGTIVGALVGGVAVALLVAWVIWFVCKRKKRAHRRSGVDPYTPATDVDLERSNAPSPDMMSSPAYSSISNDVLISQPSVDLRHEKSQVRETVITVPPVAQVRRPSLPQLAIPSPRNHTRMSSIGTEAAPPQYASIFMNQPTPSLRTSQISSPYSAAPQDIEPATVSSWTKQTVPYVATPVAPYRF